MKLEIYKNEELIDMENVVVTDFRQFLQSQKDNRQDMDLDFSVIHILQGEKTIMELSFQDQKKESLIYG
jgi:hypothetical protein